MDDIKRKRQEVYFLLKNNKLLGVKEAILSNYGCKHISELSEEELDQLIERLQKFEVVKNQSKSEQVRAWRHKILHRMSEFMPTNDWTRVNRFMLDKRVAGKLLYECSLEELKVLYRKVCNIAKEYKRREQKEIELMIKN